MKVLVIGNKDRYRKFMPDTEFVKSLEIVYVPRDYSPEEVLENAKDASAIMTDPMANLPGKVIEQLPNLKIIQSEGVGFNGVDCAEAQKRGVYVCNCKGANAGAVAEQAVLLMLALLRSTVAGDRVVREGRQIEMKERLMVEGISELGDCKIGLIGFGDIAKATAKRLLPFGCELFYYTKTPKPRELEEEYRVAYREQEELLRTCDIVSLHCPVTPETVGMANEGFFSKMKTGAYLINTARGDIVDNQALYDAVVTEKLGGAGLDTVAPEPVTKDNLLLKLPAPYAERIVFSPHIGGITTSYFRRGHAFNWGNVERAVNGGKPQFIVNGL
jgi:phosphoglycerate dehydrogenase-like enzyme